MGVDKHDVIVTIYIIYIYKMKEILGDTEKYMVVKIDRPKNLAMIAVIIAYNIN